MEENEFHQRQPLLAAEPDDILLENGLSSLGDNSSRIRYKTTKNSPGALSLFTVSDPIEN